jgi:hypothetical protein
MNSDRRYRVVRKADGLIIARNLTLADARTAHAELQTTMRAVYVIRPDSGPVERLNVVS